MASYEVPEEKTGAAAQDQDNKYVMLVSGDGQKFYVLRDAVMVSPVIKSMLRNTTFEEARTGRCEFPDIDGQVMEKVVEYFHYWYKNQEKTSVPDMHIPVELCLELLVAAEYLGLDSR